MDDRAELIRQLKKIDLATGILVEGLQSGPHHSVFKGQGIEFSEIREYVPGDDVRSIDWKVTARYSRPFIKEFTEERDQTFYFVVDISGSSGFGSDTTKQRKILEVTASLAFAAIKNNDRIGLVLFSDRVEKFIPAKRGRKHLANLFNVMIDHKAASQKTDLAAAARFLAGALSRRCSIVILSDFASPDFFLPLRILRRRHEVLAIRIADPRELDLPDVGLIELEDPETGEQVLSRYFGPGIPRALQRARHGRQTGACTRTLQKNRIPEAALLTDEPYDIPLKRFFGGVAKRRAGYVRVL